MKAYLHDPPSLHVRRTLDQFYYHMIDTASHGDQDQVVLRWARGKSQRNHNILMVDQLWMWTGGTAENEEDPCGILLDGTTATPFVITAFPDRLGTVSKGARSPSDLKELVLNVLVPNGRPIVSPHDLMGRILEVCFGVLDKFEASNALCFIQMFEESIGVIVSYNGQIDLEF